MEVITVVMGDLVMRAVVTVVLTVVVELLPVVAVAAVAVVEAMAMVVLSDLLLQEVIMIAPDMVMVEEAMAPPLPPMEAMLGLGLVMVVAMVALCTEVLMVHTEHMVVVPMVGVLTEVVPMAVVPMEVVLMVVAPQVATVLVDMVVTAEQEQEQEQGQGQGQVELPVGVQVVGVLAGTIPMGNEYKSVQVFSRMQ